MILTFFGTNGHWTDILNNNLTKYLSEHNSMIVREIKNTSSINDELRTSHIVIPLLENHIRELHEAKIKAIMPSMEMLETLGCKKKFHKYIMDNKLEYYIPNTYTSVPSDKNSLLIVKPYNLNSGAGIYIANIVTQEIVQNYIVQDYIHTHGANKYEYVTHAVVYKGKIKCHVTYTRKYFGDIFIKKAVTQNDMKYYEKVSIENKYIEEMEKILIPCKYTGVCNVDYKLVDGRMYVFEINPRFGGSLMFDEHLSDLIAIINSMINLHI